ncbi:MAG TPA: hypothetical protein VMY80_00900 [Anaerolineae bacterium]|nr:hypothetical protein [Anaerolineae bacterium]
MSERDERTRMVYADPEVVRLGKLAEERRAQGDYDSYCHYRRAMLLRQAEVRAVITARSLASTERTGARETLS